MAKGDRKSTRLNSSHRTISYAVFCLIPRPPTSTLFPYTTLFRSDPERPCSVAVQVDGLGPSVVEIKTQIVAHPLAHRPLHSVVVSAAVGSIGVVSSNLLVEHGEGRSEEHTSELQSPYDLVCRLLLDTATSDIYTLSLHDALPI